MMNMEEDNPHYEIINNIKEQVNKMGEITWKILRIKRYENMKYIRENIIDIDKASE